MSENPEQYWKGKYLKYKMKYLQEMKGGKLTFARCDQWAPQKCGLDCVKNTHILLQKDNSGQEIPICSASTLFSDSQKATVDDFIKNILPYLKVNGQHLENIEENMSVMGAGTFGISIYINDILIKIVRIANVDEVIKELEINIMREYEKKTTREKARDNAREIMKEVVKEITEENSKGYVEQPEKISTVQTNKEIFKESLKISAKDIMRQHITAKTSETAKEIETMFDIMKYQYKNNVNIMPDFYGYITSYYKFDDYAHNGLTGRNNKYILSSLPNKSNVTIELPIETYINPDPSLLFIIQQKATMNATKYFKQQITKNDLIANILKFTEDIIDTLLHLHQIGYIHMDIKLDNIVYDANSKSFKLIDFGLSEKYEYFSEPLYLRKGTPLYWINTNFETTKSFYYDWYCLYLCIMELLYQIRIDEEIGFLYNVAVDNILTIDKEVNKFGIKTVERKSLHTLHKMLSGLFKEKTKDMYNLFTLLELSHYQQLISNDAHLLNENGQLFDYKPKDQEEYEMLIKHVLKLFRSRENTITPVKKSIVSSTRIEK